MKNYIKEYGLITVAVLLIAIEIHFFKFPNHFVIGGSSGIAIVLSYFFKNISSSTFTLTINILLLVTGFFAIGKDFSMKTVYTSLLLSALLFIFSKIMPINNPLTNQPLLELCITVMLSAFGSAILFYCEASSGGTDIIAMIVNKFFKLSIGKSLFIADLIFSFFSFLFGIETGLISVFGLILKAIIIDKSTASLNLSKNCILITDHAQQVCDYITDDLHKGATIINCTGGFSGEQKQAILTVLKSSQANKLKDALKKIDNHSFLIVSNTSDILGKGFRVLI